jgi:uncharacterized membrane protein
MPELVENNFFNNYHVVIYLLTDMNGLKLENLAYEKLFLVNFLILFHRFYYYYYTSNFVQTYFHHKCLFWSKLHLFFRLLGFYACISIINWKRLGFSNILPPSLFIGASLTKSLSLFIRPFYNYQ